MCVCGGVSVRLCVGVLRKDYFCDAFAENKRKLGDAL